MKRIKEKTVDVKTKVGLFGNKPKTIIKTYDPNHIANKRMARVYLQGKESPIKVSKVKYKANLKDGSIKVKKTEFSPAEYNGSQNKTKTKKVYFKK